MIQTIETPRAVEIATAIGSIDGEQGWPTFGQDRLIVASRQFGRACLEASWREALPDISPMRATLDAIRKNPKELAFHRDRANLLKISSGWVDIWKNPNAIEETQRALQVETARQIQSRLEFFDTKSSVAHSQIRGDIAELAVLGSINFLENPNYFALPALPHHDKNHKSTNSYDLSLMHTKSGFLTAQRIQVKFRCQNLCDTPIVQPHKRNDQGRYSSAIALVSGHCDLGMGREDLSYADALARSVLEPETITNDEFDYLFHVGDRLVANLTGDDLQERLGKATTRSRRTASSRKWKRSREDWER